MLKNNNEETESYKKVTYNESVQNININEINLTLFYNWAKNILYFLTNLNSVSRGSLFYSHPQVSPPWSCLFFNNNCPPFFRLSLDFIFLSRGLKSIIKRAPEINNFSINSNGGVCFYDN